MSKKQVRISESQEIKKRITEFLNKEVSIVLKDNAVVYGTLQEASNGKVTILNKRQRKMMFPADHIMELYTDLDP